MGEPGAALVHVALASHPRLFIAQSPVPPELNDDVPLELDDVEPPEPPSPKPLPREMTTLESQADIDISDDMTTPAPITNGILRVTFLLESAHATPDILQIQENVSKGREIDPSR